MLIYKITNLINNKIYIGQYKQKYFETYWGSGKLIKRAILKYGKNNFRKEIIENNIINQQILNQKEKYWINFLNSLYPSGYNISKGGISGGMIGHRHTKYTKEKIRQKKIGQKHTAETKQKIKNANIGKHSGINNGMYGMKLSKKRKQEIRKFMKKLNKYGIPKSKKDISLWIIKGEKHPCHKLKNNDIYEIRNLYKTKNYTMKQLALKYHVCGSGICRIIQKKIWKCIDD